MCFRCQLALCSIPPLGYGQREMAVHLKMLGNVVLSPSRTPNDYSLSAKVEGNNIRCMWTDTKTGFLGCCARPFGPFLLLFSITHSEERQFTASVADV